MGARPPSATYVEVNHLAQLFRTPIASILCMFLCFPFVLSGGTLPEQPDAPSTDHVMSGLHALAAGTEVHLRLLEAVGSHTHKSGTRFRLEVAEVIVVDGAIIVPAGTPAVGEVIHAAKAGMSGKAGELILTTRYLRVGDHEVTLRSFTAGNGQNRLALATGLGVTLGIPGLFVVGKDLVLPTGTDVYAKVKADTLLPSIVGAKEADLPLPSIEELSTESNDNENDQE